MASCYSPAIVYDYLPCSQPFHHSFLPRRPNLPMKRRLDESVDHTSWVCQYGESDEDDFCISRSKRFLSEEMMSEHMQNLYLATPPHCTLFPDNHDREHEYDWSQEAHNSDYILPDYEEDPVVTSTDCKNEASVTNTLKENTVTMEENSEDSSDDDNNESNSHIWIAPEMKSLLDSSKSLNQGPSLLPDRILEDMNKPCQALVPVMESNISLLHSIYNKSTTKENKASHNSSSDTQLPPSIPVIIDEQVTNNDRLFHWYPVNHDHDDDQVDNHGNHDGTSGHYADYNHTAILDEVMEL